MRICRARLDGATDDPNQARLRDAVADADFVLAHIGAAPASLRDPAGFYHLTSITPPASVSGAPWMRRLAGPVNYGIDRARYDVDGIDITRLEDIVGVTANPNSDLFDRFWSRCCRTWSATAQHVAVSVLNYQQVIPGLMLARLLKQRGHFVVIGGTVYTKFVPQLIRRPEFSAVLRRPDPLRGGDRAVGAAGSTRRGARFSSCPELRPRRCAGQDLVHQVSRRRRERAPDPRFRRLPARQLPRARAGAADPDRQGLLLQSLQVL